MSHVLPIAPPSLWNNPAILQTKFLISSFSCAGIDDHFLGAHIISLLRKNGIRDENILFSSEKPSTLRPFRSLIGSCRILAKEEARTVHDVGMHILVQKNASRFIPDFLATGTPILLIQEYGTSPFQNSLIPTSHLRTCALGLAPEKEELGIFVHQDLLKWTLEPQTLLTRARAIETLPFSLSALIMKNIGTAEQFIDTKQLYFGTTEKVSSAISFILAIGALEPTSRKDLIFILPHLAVEELLPLVKGQSELFHAKNFSIQSYSPEKISTHNFLIQPEGIRDIRIITGSFTSEEIVLLIKAAERETIATKDESLSLAISAHKNFVYETLPHKEPIAQKLTTFFGETSTYPVASPGAYSNIEAQSTRYQAQFQRNKEDHYQRLSSMCAHICSTFDCQRPLKETIASHFENFLKMGLRKPLPFVLLSKELSPSFFSHIPFDIPTILSNEQWSILNIDDATRRSELCLDSFFDQDPPHPGYITVVRHPLERRK